MTTYRSLIAAAALVAAPVLAMAQRPQPPVPPVPPAPPTPGMQPPVGVQRMYVQEVVRMGRLGTELRQPSVTRLLNRRRQLELTPRQVTQLDSIERVLFTERKAMVERMQGQRRALQAQGQQGRPISPDSMRARMQQLQPHVAQWRQRDSVALASAERLLTEAQRQKLRELRAYARGRADARRQLRGPRAGQRMPYIQEPRGAQRMPYIQQRPRQGMPRGNQEVEVEIRRPGAGGEEEVRIERRMTRPPV